MRMSGIKSKLDHNKAFMAALDYGLQDSAYGDFRLKKYLESKAKQLAVEPRMFLPGLLGGVAHAQGLDTHEELEEPAPPRGRCAC